MGFDDVFARGHDLQEMRIRRHFARRVVLRQQLGRLARASLRSCQRDLEFGDTGANRLTTGRHHGVCHRTRMTRQL